MEHIKKLIGQKIYLSPLQAEDAPQLCRWRNDLSMTQQLGSPTQLSSIESEVERIRQYNSGEEHHFGIFSLEDDTMLGYCGIRDFNRLYQSARVGIFIGDTKNQGKGYGTEAIALLVGFGFDYLNMHSIALSVLDFNERGIASYKKIGFREYGRRHEAYRLHGQWHDWVEMEILEQWWRERKPK